MSRETAYEWARRHKAFSDAKKKGEAASLLWWEQVGQLAVLGMDLTVGGRKVEGRKISPAMWIFTMKCRFRDEGWREDVPPDAVDRKRAIGFNYIKKAK